MTADKWDGPNGQTHDESDLIATDAEIAKERKWVQAFDENDDANHIINVGVFIRILNRLAASEKECEWRGLLIQIVERGALLSRYNSPEGYGWFITYFSFQIDVPDNDGIPARPFDETVTKIKGVLNG